MATKGTIRINDVFRMLDRCARGYRFRRTQHSLLITFDGRTVAIPAGKHGKRGRGHAEIEKGHLKHAARVLGIYECARPFFK